jgi:uncharacterized membrane protein
VEPPSDSRRAWVRRVLSVRPSYWLLLAMVVYFVVSFSYSWLRAVELQTNTWDLGIYQQALWSTSHGRPFYESADYETGGFGTFLQVHSAFILYLVVPLYAAWPYQWTLFAIQSIVVSAAAYPLYLLGRDVTGSSKLGLTSGIVYLAWAPTLAANLYDFHIESFLPVEVFAFVLLWNRGRYGWGLLVAGLAFATMEFTPVLLFFAALFFFVPDGRSAFRAIRKLATTTDRTAFARATVRRFVAQQRSVFSAGLMAICALAYYLNLVFRERYLGTLLGTGAFPSAPTGYVIGGTLGELGIATQNLGVDFPAKFLSWVLLLALLGFVPLLAPRALLLAVPWAALSFLNANLNYHIIGWQYGFIEGAALLVAFVFGLGELVRIRHWLSTRWDERDPDLAEESERWSRARWRSTRHSLRAWFGRVVVGVFVALLAVNLAASPLDPTLHNASGLGGGYRLWEVSPPGFAAVQALAGLIPPGAEVLASDNLFPLVANDLHAYTLFWDQDSSLLLPFNSSHLPEYSLLSENHTYAVPAWLSEALSNRSEFGVRGVAWISPVGAVLLFEAGYRGAPSNFELPTPSAEGFSGSSLYPQAGGELVANPDPAFPELVESVAGSQGPIWSAPYTNLPVGSYTITLELRAQPLEPTALPSPSTNVLLVNAGAFAQPLWFESNLTYSALNGSPWVPVSFSVFVSEPAIEVEIRGYLSDPTVRIEIESMEIVPAA